MKFYEKLLELRKSNNLSQEALAEKLDVSRQTISKWELAQSYPDFQSLIRISNYYNISLDILIKGG